MHSTTYDTQPTSDPWPSPICELHPAHLTRRRPLHNRVYVIVALQED